MPAETETANGTTGQHEGHNQEEENQAAAASLPTATNNNNNRRSSSPLLSYGSLLNRPRSNPRSRTPMRYTSPLNADAFHRSTVLEEEEGNVPSRSRRVSVRPMAGAAVGTTISTRAQQPKPPSTKQGPSKRKVQRWNNDSFRGLAAELAAASSRGPAVAEILLQAQADAASFQNYYEPQPCLPLNDFYQEESLLKQDFFDGKVGVTSVTTTSGERRNIVKEVTPEYMWSRVNKRLQKVLLRLKLSPSMQVIDKMEQYLVQSICNDAKKKKDSVVCWDGILVEPPTVVVQQKNRKRTVVRFAFEQDAGLYRLFLHAVCQFHGLQVALLEQGKSRRCLVVSGRIMEGTTDYRLLDYVVGKGSPQGEEEKAAQNALESLTDTMSTLKVV